MSLAVFLPLLLVCCGYALWRGGAPERVAAGLQLAAFAIDDALQRFVTLPDFGTVPVSSALLDLALLGALVALAWRSTRFWPLWISGWQLAAIVGHLAKAIDPGMAPTGYAVQAQVWAYPMLIATAAGAWRHRRRVVAGDTDPSWKSLAV